MSKLEKKKEKIKERIIFLEEELKNSLGKKTHNSKEINISIHLNKINELRMELKKL